MQLLTVVVISSTILYSVTGCAGGGRPSDAEIRTCILQEHSSWGDITKPEFGKTITSQGGMIETGMDAPKGTKIFPIQVTFTKYAGGKDAVQQLWVFKDSFNALKCPFAPGR